MITAINHLAILAAEEGGHVEITAGDGGFWGETAWIMLVLPFVAFLAILAFGFGCALLKSNLGEDGFTVDSI